MGWFYGLVREKSGKIRIWEIMEEKNYLWGHRAFYSWMLQAPIVVIKDLWLQKKEMKKLFREEDLEKGNLKIVKRWTKEIKKLGLNMPPTCQTCGKPMVNAIDSKTKKISKYLWKTTCGHNKKMRMSIG